MPDNLKDILSHLTTDIDQETLLLYLQDKLPAEKKQAYKKASYTINTLSEPNDSTSIINYSNSYMKQPMDIKIIKRDNLWSIDFKYTSADSSSNY